MKFLMIKLQAPGGILLRAMAGTYLPATGGTHLSATGGTPRASRAVKWASCNLGATKPEEYGNYYQWAGLKNVTDKSIYLDWSNCPYHSGSSNTSHWTKYVPSGKSSYWSGSGSPDNKIVLDPEDDVAHVKLGGNWRMPTGEEFYELISNCKCDWVTYRGVYGVKLTSNKNGNSIFLPAAGRRDRGSFDYVESCGYYWSSSLDTGSPYDACCRIFEKDRVPTGFIYRYDGLSVRPVSD